MFARAFASLPDRCRRAAKGLFQTPVKQPSEPAIGYLIPKRLVSIQRGAAERTNASAVDVQRDRQKHVEPVGRSAYSPNDSASSSSRFIRGAMTRRIVRFLTASAAASLLLLTSARAEDTKGKWQFGFGISYFNTIDYIRDNSDLAFVTTNNDSGGLPGVGAVDERPDINILNQPSIQDDFKIDFSGSYGLTRWLALEI